MKSFAIVFAFCLVGALGMTEDQKQSLKAYKDLCIIESGVSEETIDTFKKGEPVTFDEKLNCFSACILKKVGIMNADGSINSQFPRDQIPSDLPQDQVDQIFNNCITQTGSNTCETGGNILGCLMQSNAILLIH